jgi:O-antigen/teichoic acid export membrane protein
VTRAERVQARTADVFNGGSVSSAGLPAEPAWQRNKEILGNAGSLVATSGLSALLGFAYWAVAARLFTQGAVGYAAASISAMNLLGTIGMFGLGTLLIAELPKRVARANLIAAALITAGFMSMAIGIIFVVVAPHVSVNFRNSVGTLTGGTIFAAGVAITSATLVFDQAAIGLLRGGLQLFRNSVFVIAKLMVLPAAAYILHDQFGLGIVLSWIVGGLVSLVPVAIWLWWKGSHVLAPPDWHVLRGMTGKVAAHNWLNIAATSPTMLIPVIVTIVVSPFANGAFYAAWMLVSFLYIVQTHLSTVLFAVAANNPAALPKKLRFTLLMSFAVGLPGVAVLGLGGHLLLSIFGAGYASAGTVPLALLALAYIPMVPRSYYIATCRAAGKLTRAAAVLTVAAMIELIAVVIGARWDGLVGLSLALLAVRFVTGAATTPSVVGAAIGRGRHRRGELTAPRPDVRDLALTTPGLFGTEASQQAALSLLLFLSKPEADGYPR